MATGGGTYPRPKDSHYVGGVLMPFARCRHKSLQAGAVKISIGRNARFSTLGPPQPACGGTYSMSKDSNAVVGVRDHATGKALEGTDRQTDRQTDCFIIVRLILYCIY